MTAVFAFRGWGQLAASLVALVVTVAYRHSILNISSNFDLTCNSISTLPDPVDLPFEVPIDAMWRIVIGFGCVPACIALYFRLTIPETPRFTMDIERNITRAARDIEVMYTTNAGLYPFSQFHGVQTIDAPRATRKDFFAHFTKWENGKVLLGCAWSWLVLDIAFYGLNLNTDNILQYINFDAPAGDINATTIAHDPQQVYSKLWNVARGNVILSVGGLIPGYWASFFLIDYWGRKKIQFLGFSILTMLFLIMGQ
ncbi:hypothetical protein VKT23_012275 [Stygiomarasmius scandens]|uniref:Uncharacterized protein n=1 Tax=Marasmiellus scandens TaxID=2682957 RepID=A0ABR1J777_9AGAR